MDIMAANDFIYDDLHNDEDSSYEHEDFLDSYGDDSDYYDHMTMMGSNSEHTMNELFFHCIEPTLRDVWWQFLLPILATNFIAIILFTLLIIVVMRSTRMKQFQFIISESILIISGYSLLLHHYSSNNFDQLLFLTSVIIISSIIVSVLLAFDIHNGLHFIWPLHLLFIGLNEILIFFYDSSDWIKLRPNLMLLLMKSISYFHEIRISMEKKDIKNSGSFIRNFKFIILQYSAYVLHPCAIILGIWHPHNDHSKLFITNHNNNDETRTKNFKQNIIQSFGSLFFSLLFLICSTCLIDYFFGHILFEYLDSFIRIFFADDPQQTSTFWFFIMKILRSYSIAIQFHYSHYFICFLGQSMFHLWGFDDLQVTKPLSIEWPRSLVDVVVAWNIPMHQWLKRYVFQVMKNNLKNIYLTILATYFISSYLHGLITQAEFKLRKSLAHFWSACVESRKCQYDYYVYDDDDDDDNYSLVCRHGHRKTKNIWIVRIINLFFTLLALFHLAFLGATFDGQPDSSNVENVWTVWKDLHFYPFITMIIMFVLYKMIS
ncbi:hypothetical protein DERF_002427 [Dermatophagoides farinae]|uniref:Protein-serine O-palmitoleoyltransferase porcupine n=1 Tax=Dermatophagoides farinae TaxID=6954 RepID=A0A922IBJ0_DERFA|nr:hypothetical protein DERF_002427 [Dermatophagoides farinae]